MKTELKFCSGSCVGCGSIVRRAVDLVGWIVPSAILALIPKCPMCLADFASAKFVLKNSAQVGVSTRWLPVLGALKVAGAVGLLLGLLGVRPIGIAAALGLVAFFIGAVATHVRARVFYNIAFPMAYLALAVVSLVGLL
jgi:DoxX-like family